MKLQESSRSVTTPWCLTRLIGYIDIKPDQVLWSADYHDIRMLGGTTIQDLASELLHTRHKWRNMPRLEVTPPPLSWPDQDKWVALDNKRLSAWVLASHYSLQWKTIPRRVRLVLCDKTHLNSLLTSTSYGRWTRLKVGHSRRWPLLTHSIWMSGVRLWEPVFILPPEDEEDPEETISLSPSPKKINLNTHSATVDIAGNW